MTTTLVNIDVSQPQHTPAGLLLGKMYYGGFLEAVLSRSEYSGYPHNGGVHSLYLCMKPDDLNAFIECVQTAFPGREGVSPFIDSIRTEVSKRYPSLKLH